MGKFKKGNPGGPGRPKDTIYQKLLKGKMKEEYYEFMFKCWDLSIDEMGKLINNKNNTVPQQIFYKWFLDLMKEPSSQDIITLGKFCGVHVDKLTVDNISSDRSMSPFPHNMTNDEIDQFIQRYKELRELNEESE